jgi:hypothetical protein
LALLPAETKVLGALCNTLFPSLAGKSSFYHRSASDLSVDQMLADAIQNSMQPENSRDFRRVLSIVESPLYNLLLTGRPVRFSNLDPSARERYLASWRDSSLALKRTAFQALKRLTLFLAYASVDTTPTNPNWAEIGFPGPSGDSPTLTPEPMHLKPLLFDKDTKVSCDVVVVGSGAGGSIIAEDLSARGLDVVVVEQGPYETSETFKQNEMRMMQKLFQQSGPRRRKTCPSCCSPADVRAGGRQ